jgi:parallel beta-helix repeat protein
MNETRLRKFLVMGIIILLIGTGTISSTAQTVVGQSAHNVSKGDILNANPERTNSTSEYTTLPAYRKHFFPIYIMNNDDLKGIRGKYRGVLSGSGTKADPYIISGWDIQSRRLISCLFKTYNGIHLENIDKYVIIRDNYIHDIYNEGIILKNCKNITVENNIITGSDQGVQCFAYPGYSVCVIRNNTIYDMGYGITAAYSFDSILDNTISNCFRGITCNNAQALVAHNTVFLNTNGIGLIGDDNSQVIYNNIYGNMEDGINVGVSTYHNPASTISNNEIYSNGGCGISCWMPMNTSIRNNSIYRNYGVGIYISESNPMIINNTIFENRGGYGIYICGYLGFTIDHNNISWQDIGISSYLSDSLIITNNSVTQNTYGIECRSSHPLIHYNNFVGNGCAVFGDGWMGHVNATSNWWGAANGPGGSGPGNGDPVSENVDYDPWLTSPNPNAG